MTDHVDEYYCHDCIHVAVCRYSPAEESCNVKRTDADVARVVYHKWQSDPAPEIPSFGKWLAEQGRKEQGGS